jgi:hypothetical protein
VDGITTLEVKLPFGTLFADRNNFPLSMNRKPCATEDSKLLPSYKSLSDAYEQLEEIRKLNLEVTCSEMAITVNHEACTLCLLAPPLSPKSVTEMWSWTHQVLPSPLASMYAPQACLLCNSPTCKKHTSETLRPNHVTICIECEKVIRVDFVAAVLTTDDTQQRQQKLDHLIDIYDRAILLLKFSSQYIEDLILSLEESALTTHKWSITGNASGMVSGALGMAAAATIFTPAGSSLLLASLLMGGGATAVQMGAEARTHFSEPHRLAHRIFALSTIAQALLGVVSTLRDVITRDVLRSDFFDESSSFLHGSTMLAEDARIREDNELMTHITLGRCKAACIEMGVVSSSTTKASGTFASRNVQFFSKAGTGLQRALRIVQATSGVLSAATFVLEARSLHATLEKVEAGSPCEKAECLRRIQKELSLWPDTSSIDRECTSYLEIMSHRKQQMTEEEVKKLLFDESDEDKKQQDKEESAPNGDVDVAVATTNGREVLPTVSPQIHWLGRVQRFLDLDPTGSQSTVVDCNSSSPFETMVSQQNQMNKVEDEKLLADDVNTIDDSSVSEANYHEGGSGCSNTLIVMNKGEILVENISDWWLARVRPFLNIETDASESLVTDDNECEIEFMAMSSEEEQMGKEDINPLIFDAAQNLRQLVVEAENKPEVK